MTKKEICFETIWISPELQADIKCKTVYRDFTYFRWGYFKLATVAKGDLYFVYDVYNT